jgi:zinc transporter ZupT
MLEDKKNKATLAGGVFIALGMLLGAIIGIYLRQPSAGMVIGFFTGTAAAILVWLFDRFRRR